MPLDYSTTHQQHAPTSAAMNSVQITKADDEWNVTVVEDGKVSKFEFLVEAHALIFAAGQRARLDLPNQ